MSHAVLPAAPSGFPPGLPAELAAAVLWFMTRLRGLVFWRMTGHRHAAHAFTLSHYLGRGVARFGRVMARLAAGEVFRVRASRAGQVRKAPAGPRVRLPMEYGWVARLGEDVRMTAAIIGHHLNRTEVLAMIAACPQAQRVLRPICHLLAIDAPCVPRLVRKRRVTSQAAAPPSPQPSPANVGEGVASRRGLTRKEREAILWYPNLEGKPMKLLPRKLPRD